MGAMCAADGFDRALLAAIAVGDQHAFEKLYRRYRTRVYDYISSIVRQRTIAEDLLAETMIVLWQQARRFPGRSRVSTWIFGIARHKALDALRSQSRRPICISRDPDSLPQAASTPDESAVAEELVVFIRRALQLLTREHHEALRLAYYEEMRYPEIALLMDVPANTVKSRVYYAKQALGRQLAPVLGTAVDPRRRPTVRRVRDVRRRIPLFHLYGGAVPADLRADREPVLHGSPRTPRGGVLCRDIYQCIGPD
jgi:RNA polymerase sigma-70 factor (ECF subfamily)